MEIGSEYSLGEYPMQAEAVCIPQQLKLGVDQCLTWLGRTAIDLVLADILVSKLVRNVYMPSYCCDSMAAPFLERGIVVQYYPVNFIERLCIEPDLGIECDIFFAMNYFSAALPEHESILQAFRDKGAVIVEDITHSLFSTVPHHHCADYAVASLRKWMESPAGGIAVKFGANFLVEAQNIPSEEIVKLRVDAMREKDAYLKGETTNKASYMEKYAKFNASLEYDYREKRMDVFSMTILGNYDFSGMIEKRRRNATFLWQELQMLSGITPMVAPNENDVLLFLPVLINAEKRDALHRALIEASIYCPKHWPAPKDVESNIYSQEISLVCDQRYGIADMERIINCIQKYLYEDGCCGHLF